MSKIILEITEQEAEEIILTRRRYGLFWVKENGKFIGIDNTSGDAWTEEFNDLEICILWLSSDISIEDLQ